MPRFAERVSCDLALSYGHAKVGNPMPSREREHWQTEIVSDLLVRRLRWRRWRPRYQYLRSSEAVTVWLTWIRYKRVQLSGVMVGLTACTNPQQAHA